MSEPSWHTDAYPELRDAPPWVMQEMMARQPALATALLGAASTDAQQIAATARAALDAGRPVTVCGCGTSEHGAHAVAALLRAALPGDQRPLVHARPSLTAALDPRPGLCLAVSHDGETHATLLALQAAQRTGARTAAVTAAPDSSVARAADHTIVTPDHDRSWCHTLAYTSALLTGAALGAELGLSGVSAAGAHDLLDSTTDDAKAVATALADRRVILCAGIGVDHITARELALKIAEGARIPTVALELETVLHGQLAGHEDADGLVVVAIAESPEPERVTRRIEHIAQAAAAIGLPVAALLSSDYANRLPADLTPAGRVTVDLPASDVLQPDVAALLAGAAALQSLTLELAHVLGLNPDLIRREQGPYREAANAAESAAGW